MNVINVTELYLRMFKMADFVSYTPSQTHTQKKLKEKANEQTKIKVQKHACARYDVERWARNSWEDAFTFMVSFMPGRWKRAGEEKTPSCVLCIHCISHHQQTFHTFIHRSVLSQPHLF